MLNSKDSDLFQLTLFQFNKMKINAHKLVNLPVHAYPIIFFSGGCTFKIERTEWRKKFQKNPLKIYHKP